MIVLCDVDGVLADFTGGLLKAVGSELTPAQITKWNIFDHLQEEGPRLESDALEVLRDGYFWRTLEPYSGVRRALDRMRKLGATVLAVSARWNECPTWCSDRERWLEEHTGIKASEFMAVPSTKKHLICGDVMIEDKPETLHEWFIRNPMCAEGFLVDRPYNASNVGRRVSSIVDVADWMEDYTEERKR